MPDVYQVNLFFGHYIDPLSLLGKAMVLLLAVLMGGIIGAEREFHSSPAGMRTHILVCVGATLMTLTSVEIGMRGGMRGDPGHIAAQIVSGIGFLGAGAIMREGVTVRGLTTAASVWTTAGIGITLGASPRLGELAVVATCVVLLTLTVLTRVEVLLKLRQPIHNLDIEVKEENLGPARLLDRIQQFNVVVYGIASTPSNSAADTTAKVPTRQMHIRVNLPQNFDRNAFNIAMAEEGTVVSFHLD